MQEHGYNNLILNAEEQECLTGSNHDNEETNFQEVAKTRNANKKDKDKKR